MTPEEERLLNEVRQQMKTSPEHFGEMMSFHKVQTVIRVAFKKIDELTTENKGLWREMQAWAENSK